MISPSSPASPTRPNVIRQRLFRGLDALWMPVRTLDETPASAHLSAETLPLYQAMSKTDRAHSLRVLGWLQVHGHRHPDLATAALLHDCGKSAAKLRVWHRTIKVLLRRIAPGRWSMLSRPACPGTWRYPYYILRTHAFRGAYAAEKAGCSQLTCWLIANHEVDPDEEDDRYPYMRALQDADAAS